MKCTNGRFNRMQEWNEWKTTRNWTVAQSHIPLYSHWISTMCVWIQERTNRQTPFQVCRRSATKNTNWIEKKNANQWNGVKTGLTHSLIIIDHSSPRYLVPICLYVNYGTRRRRKIQQNFELYWIICFNFLSISFACFKQKSNTYREKNKWMHICICICIRPIT